MILHLLSYSGPQLFHVYPFVLTKGILEVQQGIYPEGFSVLVGKIWGPQELVGTTLVGWPSHTSGLCLCPSHSSY